MNVPARTSAAAPASRPHVAFVNRSYWPDTEATGQLLTELCEELAGRYRVTALCGLPNKTFEADALAETERHGVSIRRVGHTRYAKRHRLGRILNWLTFGGKALWSGLWMKRPDVLVVETDPPFLCVVGRLLAWRHRCKLTIYLQDIYPDIAVALKALPEGMFAAALRKLFRATYRSADRVVVLSADMRKFLVTQGFSEERIDIVPNWIDSALVKPQVGPNAFRAAHGLDGKFVAMYSGNLGNAQQLEHVVEAARRLQSHDDIRFVFVGDGAQRPELEAAAAGLPNVSFHDYQPKHLLGQSLSAADVQLIPLHPSVTPYMMPSKLYGVLAAGVPALVAAPYDCELAHIVRTHQCGLVAPPDDPEALVRVLLEASQNRERLRAMGANGRRLAEERYDRSVGTGRFAALLEGLLAAPAESALRLPVPETVAR